jgi:hypothetical protein
MNKFQIFILKTLRKFYQLIFGTEKIKKPDCIQDADLASQIIFDALTSDNPCMITRFGSTELTCLMNYIGIKHHRNKYLTYFQGKTQQWWWDQKIIDQMQNWSGFFPPTQFKVEQFCRLILQDIPEVDVLGSWLVGENIFKDQLVRSQKVHFRLLEPFWSKFPWTSALADKKVLVVHPFAETIISQYQNREKLFGNPDILPKFKSFEVLNAVQSLGEGDDRFDDWFAALDHMKSEIDKQDYDVCLIGCGACGFHLAAHVKRNEKKSVHLGGALQLLFGIKGKRWEDPNYGVKEWGIPVGSYSNLMNEYWVRPGDVYKPKNADKVEGACYW